MQSQAELTGIIGCGSGGDEGNDNQDREMKAVVQQCDEQAQQLHQPQKCPRCDSMNTKFCYYNNYSFSQPRYFCKTCRRYWTQGGTLRNVPVGGSCRKGKRARTSGENSRSVPPQQPHEEAVPGQLGFTAAARPLMISTEQVIRVNEPGGLGSFGSYDQGGGAGGYMSTLAAIQSLNPSSQAAYNQSINAGAGDLQNLGLSPGFGISALGPRRQRHIHSSPALYHGEQGLMPSTMAASGSAGVWAHGYGNDANNQRASEAPLWSTRCSTISSASINGNSDSNVNGGGGGGGGSSSLIPNQWRHLPGYGPPHS